MSRSVTLGSSRAASPSFPLRGEPGHVTPGLELAASPSAPSQGMPVSALPGSTRATGSPVPSQGMSVSVTPGLELAASPELKGADGRAPSSCSLGRAGSGLRGMGFSESAAIWTPFNTIPYYL